MFYKVIIKPKPLDFVFSLYRVILSSLLQLNTKYHIYKCSNYYATILMLRYGVTGGSGVSIYNMRI